MSIEHQPSTTIRPDEPHTTLIAVPSALLAKLRSGGGLRNVHVEVVNGGPPDGRGLQLVVHRG